MMKFRQLLDPGTAASLVGHAAALALILVFAGIRPFNSESAQAITVDLVTPDEIKPPAKDETPPPPEPKLPDLDLKQSLDKPDTAQQPPPPQPATEQQPAPPPPAPKPPPPTQAQTPQSETQQAAAPAQQPPPPATPVPTPAFKPPEPDLAVKYGINLGLPDAPSKNDFDDTAFKAAKIASTDIEAFRRHLKTCSAMPDTVNAADDVWIKLRATFTTDGRLAAAPILIEGKASPKALALASSAIAALQACQPYAMLPADKYNEWKVLDLEFSPRDFDRG
jgi:outer membrane biosynthesis protein TonB